MNDFELMEQLVRFFVEHSKEGHLPMLICPKEVGHGNIYFGEREVPDLKPKRVFSVLIAAVDSGLLSGRFSESKIDPSYHIHSVTVFGVTALGHKFFLHGMEAL